MDLMNGFSLVFPVFLVTLGGAGSDDREARRHAPDPGRRARLRGGSVAVLVISLTHLFIIPTICIAFFTLCFVLASVPQPDAV